MHRFLLLASLVLIPTASGMAAVALHPELERAESWMQSPMPGARPDPLAQALRTLNAGRHEEAVAQIRAAIARLGESAPALELLGAALALSGEIPAAEAALRRAIALDPRQAGAFAKLADVQLARGDETAAVENLARALALTPEDRRIHQRLGLIAKRRGDVAAAIGHLERGILGTPPGYVGVKLDLATLYNAEQRFAHSIALLSDLTGQAGFDVTGWLLLGAAHLGAGDAPRAQAAAEQALALQPAEPAVLQAFANARRAALGPAGAALTFEDLVLPSPAATLATFDIVGNRLLMTGELDRAEAVFRRMTQRFPNDAGAQFRLGTFLASRTNYQAALPVLERAAALDSRRADIARAQALAASRVGQPQLAVRHAVRMLTLLPSPGPADHFLLGSLRHEAGDLPGAEGDYRRSSRPRAFAPALNNLANIRADRAELPAAQRLAEQAVALAPEAGWARSTLGWILLQRGELVGAAQALEKAAQLSPDDPTTLYHMAALRSAQGQPEEARVLLHRALAQGNFPKRHLAEALVARLG
ncbi:tetratricopeptide repeat protein [Falsiroseomonas sp. E2-1-a4]|uniref:tetratricopeptide repeat protein n=1 Tax=Falsiroseomonas sp. E2-1-a4 TaxID=3239299 RepID=UPI003F361D16